MATGLIALLDDVAALAKVAAASLDDVAAQAAKAGSKAAGIVIDDAAVTPRYVVGFSADRELPIVAKIARGSLRNKLFFLLPAALALGFLAPWAITPILMLGGVYLCYEGAEKVVEAVFHRDAASAEAKVAAIEAHAFEEEKVRSAIKTDFILSAEIMAIALSQVSGASLWTQAAVLATVALGITVAVYGGVALIVKADDLGVALAASDRPVSGLFDRLRRKAADRPATWADRMLRPITRPLGRGLVFGMPKFLALLALVGTAAMLWVGGGIILHGLEEYGLGALAHLAHDLGAAAGAAVPPVAGFAAWFVEAAAAGLFGIAVGLVAIPLAHKVAAPALALIGGRGGASK